MISAERTQDKWARWLLRERFGSSDEQRRSALAYVEDVRDRVLDGAALTPSDVVLDVGCGDGLLGFGALDRVPEGRVVFTDLSADLLAECRRLADEAGVADRCDFVLDSLPALAGIPDGAADVAAIRSVLIYVADKPAAFANLFRVLRPGGRLSLFEPISGFAALPPERLWGFDFAGLEDLAARVQAVVGRHTAPGTLLGWDERDLIGYAEAAGFDDIELIYEARTGHNEPNDEADLATFLQIVPNPTMPSLGAVIEEALDAVDAERIRQRIDDQLRSGGQLQRYAICYLRARKR